MMLELLAISCNVKLQEFDITGNSLKALGAIIIAKDLQKVLRLTKLHILIRILININTDKVTENSRVAVSNSSYIFAGF